MVVVSTGREDEQERLNVLHQLVRLTAALQVRNDLEKEDRERGERREERCGRLIWMLVLAVLVLAGANVSQLFHLVP